MTESAATGNAGDDDAQVPEHKQGLSKERIARIEQGRRLHGPAVLAELAEVLVSYPREPTPERLAITAAYVQAIFPGDPHAFRDWIDQASLTVFDQEEDLAWIGCSGRLVGVPQLVEVWGVTREEAEIFGLQHCVPEAVRSALRRAQERPEEAAPKAPSWPGPSCGMSRATWYRQQAGAGNRAVARAIKEEAGLVWTPESGVSKRTFYRQRKGGTKREIPTDRIEDDFLAVLKAPMADHPSSFLNYLVGLNLTFSATAPVETRPARPATPPSLGILPTAACRRLAKYCLDRGFRWTATNPDMESPHGWFILPDDAAPLSEADVQAYYRAVSAAAASIEELHAVRRARERKEAKEGAKAVHAAQETPSGGTGYPTGIWESIDPRVQPWVRRGIARLFMHHGGFSMEMRARLALRIVPACTRMAALEELLLRRQPGLLLEQSEAAIFQHYWKARDEAVQACVSEINGAFMKQTAPRDEKVDAEIRRELLAQGVPERLHGVVHAGVYAMIVVQNVFDKRAGPIVALFAAWTTEQWASQISNKWYRDFLKAHPDQDPAPGVFSTGVVRRILSVEEAERTHAEQKARQAANRAAQGNPELRREPVDPDAEPRFATRREEHEASQKAIIASIEAELAAMP